MSGDALERLKKRKRPNVKPRDKEAIEPKTPESASTNAPSNQDTKTPDTPYNEYLEGIETKASTMRLEANLAQEMTLYCKQNGISREVLVEAMFAYLQQKQEAREIIEADAKARASKRQEASNRRRAKTMMQRFGANY